MLWLKAFHIVVMVTWFAGLFYLPRLLVYFVEAAEPDVRGRLKVMQRRLLVMTHIGMALAVGFGLALTAWWMKQAPDYLVQGHWFHAKMTLVVALLGYHAMLARLVAQARQDQLRRSSRWLRWFNEVPSVLLIGIVILVVVKPF